MSFETILSTSAIIVVGVILYLVRKITIYGKLSKFPGPFLSGFTDLPLAIKQLSNTVETWCTDLCEKHGNLVRVAPNMLVTSSPELWTHVNKDKRYTRSEWFYKALRFEHRRDNVFSQTDNEKHDQRRKQMMPGYSGRENFELERSIDQCVTEFLHLIRSKYISTEQRVVPMDLAPKVQFFTMDVTGLVGLGKRFGMMKQDRDVDDYLASAAEGIYLANIVVATGLSWILHAPVIGKYLMPSANDETGYGKLIAACFRAVDERVANPTDTRSDMLASFIRNGITGDDLRSEAIEQVLAGSETTATAIRGILLHVMTNLRVYAKLQREVDEFCATTVVVENVDKEAGIISFAQARKLPYLQAVIREGLRIFPPLAGFFPRDVPLDVPSGGDTVPLGDGRTVFIPGGTCISLVTTALHHSREVYGDDAKSFRPERWFEPDPDKLEKMMEVNDLIFGYGRFKCLGKPVAQIELAKVLFELMRNFDMAILNPTKPWDMRLDTAVFAITNMWVQVMERSF